MGIIFVIGALVVAVVGLMSMAAAEPMERIEMRYFGDGRDETRD